MLPDRIHEEFRDSSTGPYYVSTMLRLDIMDVSGEGFTAIKTEIHWGEFVCNIGRKSLLEPGGVYCWV